MTFLFAAGLWAIPLAAAPVLLHLLLRPRAPVVPFSTLRFARASMRHTAAGRRLRQWLLMGCRTLLMLLLIAAVAQPALRAAGAGRSGRPRWALAAVVVDTSYSMLLRQDGSTLLDQADAAVRSLLGHELSGAKVALFTSAAAGSWTSSLPRDASAVTDEWAPLSPQSAPQPLVDRIAAASALLESSRADTKRLIVISDFQAREFPHPLPRLPQVQTLLLDLHPPSAHSAGVSGVAVSPTQPLPGVESQAVVEVIGQPSTAHALQLKASAIDGSVLWQASPSTVTLDAGGHGAMRFPVMLGGQRWTLLQASLTAADDMPWDDRRQTLVELPPKQPVMVVSEPAGAAPEAERFARLALDPSEGAQTAWPLAVRSAGGGGSAVDARARSLVALLSAWPSAAEAEAWAGLARAGGSVVLFLRPGLQATWAQLPAGQQRAIQQLLPAPPVPESTNAAEPRCAAVAAAGDPLLAGLADQPAQWSRIVVRQMVPLGAPDSHTTTVLNAVALDPTPSSRPAGMLFRKRIGAGTCFTVATVPDEAFTNFATQPAFLPMLVRMALAGQVGSSAPLNAEIGQPLVLPASASGVGSATSVQVESPKHEIYRIGISGGGGERKFVFDQSGEAGIYRWRAIGAGGRSVGEVIALTNVQLPAAESDLTYRPAAGVIAPGGAAETIVAHSLGELRGMLVASAAPRPQWSLPIAAAMFLLCIEALLGSGVVQRMGGGRLPTAATIGPPAHSALAARS